MKLALAALALAALLLALVVLWPAPRTPTITIIVPRPPTAAPARPTARPVRVLVIQRATARPTPTAVPTQTAPPAIEATPAALCYWWSEEYQTDVESSACPEKGR